MCTFDQDPALVTVCDVAIERYRQALEPQFGPSVEFVHVECEGTRVKCVDRERVPQFEAEVRRLMAEQ